jgi:hypothetical protein
MWPEVVVVVQLLALRSLSPMAHQEHLMYPTWERRSPEDLPVPVPATLHRMVEMVEEELPVEAGGGGGGGGSGGTLGGVAGAGGTGDDATAGVGGPGGTAGNNGGATGGTGGDNSGTPANSLGDDGNFPGGGGGGQGQNGATTGDGANGLVIVSYSVTEPANQPTAIAFSAVTPASMDVGFTQAAGNPGGYLVIRRTGASPTGVPVDGITYAVNDVLGDGTVEFIGTYASIPFNDASLTAGTAYHYDIFSFNGSGSAINYRTTSPLEGSRSTTVDPPTTQPTGMTFTTITSTTMRVNYAAPGDGAGRLLVAKSGSAVSVIPADGATYTPDGNFGTGTDLGSGNIVVGLITSAATGFFDITIYRPALLTILLYMNSTAPPEHIII